jgi:predicted dehydrogenase
MISAGIIGYKNHSKKIITLLKKKVEIKYIFHPRKEIKIKNFTNNIDDLLNTDCIFVLCPSQYHFFYINYFIKKRFKGYIFCEKLPVTKVSDLKKLSKIVNNKCYFNYNLRHSILNDYFRDHKIFGKIIQISIHDSKPYIYKKRISKNWRTDTHDTLLTNNFSHYLDLINYCFKKKINKLQILKRKINSQFRIIDSIQLSFEIKKIFTSIFISYATVLDKKISLYYTNAKIEIDDNFIKIFHPYNNMDTEGYFKKPKLFYKKSVKKIFKTSNKNSLDYFIETVSNKKIFNKNDLKISIDSNKIILDISKKLI